MITSNSLPELNTLRSYDNGHQIYFDWVFKEIVLISVFIKVYIAMIKHHNQKQFEKDSVYFLYSSRAILCPWVAGTQGRNVWQEVKRPCRALLVGLFTQPAFVDSPGPAPGGGITHSGLDYCTSVISQSNSAYRSTLWRRFFHSSFPSPRYI